LSAHWVIDAEPAAGQMILGIPASCRNLSPARTTPVFTLPITPVTSDIEASSCPMSAPRSFFASSSRSTISILSFLPPTGMPPAALISAMASFEPSRVETPIGAEPPEYGPVRASLMVSAARAWADRVESKMASSFFIGTSSGGGDVE
jgi:hypothetical protein